MRSFIRRCIFILSMSVLCLVAESKSKLTPGECLKTNDALYSDNNLHRAIMQEDGDFVLYRIYPDGDQERLWAQSSKEIRKGPYQYCFNKDGKLGLADSTGDMINPYDGLSDPIVSLELCNNGTLQMRVHSGRVDHLHVPQNRRSDQRTLQPDNWLYSDSALYSSNTKYYALLNDDGNFGVYNDSNGSGSEHLIWSNNLSLPGAGPFKLYLSKKGNLMIFNKDFYLAWMTSTYDSRGVEIKVTDDGLLHGTYNSQVVWSPYTITTNSTLPNSDDTSNPSVIIILLLLALLALAFLLYREKSQKSQLAAKLLQPEVKQNPQYPQHTQYPQPQPQLQPQPQFQNNMKP